MVTDNRELRSRRALLAAAAGAVAATAVNALTKPSAADATTDHVVYLNNETASNVLEVSTVYGGSNYPDSGKGMAIYANSQRGVAIQGYSDSGNGVWGYSNVGWGVKGHGGGTGVVAESSQGTGLDGSSYYGTGVYGRSVQGSGVHGLSSAASGFTNGVWGENASTGGNGVYGFASSATGYTGGVSGESASSGGVGVWGYTDAGSTGTMGVTGPNDPGPITKTGVYGTATQASGQSRGVVGQTWSLDGVGVTGVSGTSALPTIYGNIGVHGYSVGRGVFGQSGPTGTGVHGNAVGGKVAIGVRGSSDSGTGVRGESTTGRAGVFQSNVAQLKLTPSTLTTHPAKGQRGDLFVDTSGRLWFCKGGTTWKQLA
jgi:hypothetical protein